MFHLVTAVLAVALTATVVAGGATYLRPDFGVRRLTAEQVFLSYRAFDSAVSAYRISNNGALPATGPAPASNHDAAPWWQVRPYLAGEVRSAGVNGAMSPPPGMDWFFVRDSVGTPWLCLQSLGSGRPIPEAVLGALRGVNGRVPESTLSRTCESPDTPPSPEQAALRLRIQSAGR